MGRPKKLTWTTEKRRLSDLHLQPGNPRRRTERGEAELKESIRRFDVIDIPAVDTENVVLGGNQRVDLLIHAGRGDEEIDVRVPSRPLSEREAKEITLRLNRNIAGEWDAAKLLDFGEDLLMDVGFDSSELEIMQSPAPSILDGTAETDQREGADYFNTRSKGTMYWSIGEVAGPVDRELMLGVVEGITSKYQPEQYQELLERLLAVVKDVL